MEIRQLEYFNTVCSEKSFSAAARKLCITQPAVTKSISSLEAELGIKLLNRTKTGIFPTEAGKILFQYSSRILFQMESAKNEMQTLVGSPVQKLNICVHSIISSEYFMPSYMQFSEKHPEMKLSFSELISPYERINEIEKNYDLFITMGTREDYPFARLIKQGEIKCVSKAESHSNIKKYVSLNSLSKHNASIISHYANKTGKPLITCSSLDTIISLLSDSGNAAFVPDLVINKKDYNILPFSKILEASLYISQIKETLSAKTFSDFFIHMNS